jgi:predicted SAM-dependent methyltransferase
MADDEAARHGHATTRNSSRSPRETAIEAAIMKNIIRKLYAAAKYLFRDIMIRGSAFRSPRKVIIGAAGVSQPGWIETDIGHLNVLREKDWARYFDEASIDAVLAEHVLEHLTVDDGFIAGKNCLKFLKSGGYFRVAVPDGNFPDPQYIDYVKPGGSGYGSSDHKVLYTYKTLGDLLQRCGFRVNLLEYWDEQGKFHSHPWNADDGLIHRSRWHDHRNSKTEIRYTSVVLDAVKP